MSKANFVLPLSPPSLLQTLTALDAPVVFWSPGGERRRVEVCVSPPGLHPIVGMCRHTGLANVGSSVTGEQVRASGDNPQPSYRLPQVMSPSL